MHLTDFHIKISDNFISSRIDKIHDALIINLLSLERIYLVITGYIVDKGVQAGYPYAKEFLDKLKTKLETINNKLTKVSLLINY